MDPTNFYPMICGAANPEQASRMINEHLLNEDEFQGPANVLVYPGLMNYDCKDVRDRVAEKPLNLLMKDWTIRGYIFENWNSVTGVGDEVGNSDKFYHW